MISSLISSLKACARRKDLHRGTKIHSEICNLGLLQKNLYLANTIVSMYAKCDALALAQQVLDELRCRDVVSWNALIGGYARNGHGKEALECFHRMQSEGLPPDAFTYACIIKACAMVQDVSTGERIHDEIASLGLLEDDMVLGTSLIDMYAKCGELAKAQEVMDKLRVRDAVSWNALITGYTQHNEGHKALECFDCMKRERLSPDSVTYACVLKACGITKKLEKGEQIHKVIVSCGLLEKNIVLGNSLVLMYAKCGLLSKAKDVLYKLQVRDVISWSALIDGYAEKAQVDEAFGCFQLMQRENIHPNAMTYASILKACSSAKDGDLGARIHEEIANQGALEQDVVVGTALIHMYAKCGVMSKARKVFDELFHRDLVSWSALISGYAQQGQGLEALCCFQQMRNEGLCPDAVLYASILKVCSITSEDGTGKQIHDEILYQGLLEKDSILGNALVNMYAKSGVPTKAQKVIDGLPAKDVGAWNALIAGYAQEGFGAQAQATFGHMRTEGLFPNALSWNALMGAYAQQGQADVVLSCFEHMQRDVSPNEVTYLIVLNACSHAGLVEEGQMHLLNMIDKHGIRLNREHQTCMVDLFGRAQHLEMAMEATDNMPFADYPPVWFALLGACTKWGNIKLGKVAFDSLLQLDVRTAAAFVSMANVFVAAGMQNDVQKTKSRTQISPFDQVMEQVRISFIKRPERDFKYGKCGEADNSFLEANNFSESRVDMTPLFEFQSLA